MKLFFRGALILVIATFLGECVEFIVNLVLARELGERGMGLYMTILPTIFLIVLLASFELPISISKFIAEKDEKYHRSMLHHTIRFTILFTCILFIAAALVLPFLGIFASYHPFLRWIVILLIPLVSFSSIARGYFMGKQQMGKIAISHFLRKIIQLLLLVTVYQLFQFQMETALLIAFCTLLGSELAVFAYLVYSFVVHYHQLSARSGEPSSGRTVRSSLISVSVPMTGMRIFHALTHAVQPFLIKAALIQAGIEADAATGQFGILAGVALTIGLFPAFIAHSLLIVLIPTVSKAYSNRETSQLHQLLQLVILITAIYGIPSILIIYFFAEPLTDLFFHSSHAPDYLQLLWPYFLFHFFAIPLQAYLIGLGLIRDAFIHNLWSTVISFFLIYWLGSESRLQMGGVIIGMNAGAILLTLLHYVTICKKIGLTWTLKRISNLPIY